jgi:hypothetical protein
VLAFGGLGIVEIMNQTEIDGSLAVLQERVMDEVARAVPFSESEAVQALAEAVATLNAFNPKNKQAYAMETAPFLPG